MSAGLGASPVAPTSYIRRGSRHVDGSAEPNRVVSAAAATPAALRMPDAFRRENATPSAPPKSNTCERPGPPSQSRDAFGSVPTAASLSASHEATPGSTVFAPSTSS